MRLSFNVVRARRGFFFQEFIRLGCLSKLSGKGLQQRMFFLVGTLALKYRRTKKRKAKPPKNSFLFFPPVQRLAGVHQPGDDSVQPVQGPRPAAPLRHGGKRAPRLLIFGQFYLFAFVFFFHQEFSRSLTLNLASCHLQIRESEEEWGVPHSFTLIGQRQSVVVAAR